MNDRLNTSLQESVLTLLCMDKTQGQIAAGLVDVELFEPPYDDIAGRVIEYRQRYKEPPGEAHIDDLFDHILSDPKNKKQKLYQNVLGGILDTASKLNPQYTLSRLDHFMRRQNLKAAILEAAERFQRGGETDLTEAEIILNKGLRFHPEGLERGMYLGDKKGIEFLTRYDAPDFKLGIEALDRMGVGLTRGETFGLMAAKGRGKTWACVHVGVSTLMQAGKSLHLSLEMGEQRIIPRYLRKLFAIAKSDERYRRTKLELDKLGRVTGFDTNLEKALLSLKDPKLERKVAAQMEHMGARLNRLHFKSFPTSRLSMDGLRAYLDNLEASDGFVPDGLILDYPKLMRLRRNVDLRIALGETMEELRGLCVERNMFGFFPFQTNRTGEEESNITAANIGEDYSLAQTVDVMLTYNQTKAEKVLGLARLYADKVRTDRDGFTVLIVQDYESGQFCRQSALMPNQYFKLIKEHEDPEEEAPAHHKK